MRDALAVQILYAVQNLQVKLVRLSLCQPVFLNDVIEQFPTRSVLHDEINSVFGFNNLVQLHKRRVINFLQDLNFPDYSLNVSLVLDPRFLKYLHSYKLLVNKISA